MNTLQLDCFNKHAFNKHAFNKHAFNKHAFNKHAFNKHAFNKLLRYNILLIFYSLSGNHFYSVQRFTYLCKAAFTPTCRVTCHCCSGLMLNGYVEII